MSRLRDIADLRSDKVQPSDAQDSTYIGLEHIQQQTLALSGVGMGADVSSQKQRFYRGDVLFGKLRPYFRKVILAREEGICSTDIWVVRPKDEADSAFILYLLASQEFIEEATNTSEGSRMPRANWRVMSDYEFPDFTAHERVKIGEFLSLFDEKIKENRHASALLEKTSQSLFKSWFIDFDPVKAKMAGNAPVAMDAETAALFPDSMEESKLGPIPSGWTTSRLADLVELVSERATAGGATLELPYVPIDQINSKSIFIKNWLSGEEAKTSLVSFLQGDVLFGAMRPYFHKVCLAPFVGTTRSTVFVLRPRDSRLQIFSLMQMFAESTIEFATNNSSGSTIPYAKWKGVLENLEVVVPTTSLLDRFQELTEDIVKTGYSFLEENQTLSSLRDELLPRLVSGELKIPGEMLVE